MGSGLRRPGRRSRVGRTEGGARCADRAPSRKTDVKDSEWICDLVAHGLVRPSFVPPPEIRRLTDFTRLRKAQINERARVIQRLERSGRKPRSSSPASPRVRTRSLARAMLEALLSGVSDPKQLAELAKARMRQKIPQLREALANRFQIDHLARSAAGRDHVPTVQQLAEVTAGARR